MVEYSSNLSDAERALQLNSLALEDKNLYEAMERAKKRAEQFLVKILPFVIILGIVSPIEQIISLVTVKERERVPVVGMFTSFISSSIWFMYGKLRSDRHVLFSSTLGIVLGSTLIGSYFFIAE